MARAPLTVYPISRAGMAPTYVLLQITGSGGNSFVNNGDTILHVKNAHANTACNLSIARTRTVDGVAPAVRVVVIAAQTEMFIGDLDPNDFNHSDGTVYIDPDFITTVTAAVIQP